VRARLPAGGGVAAIAYNGDEVRSRMGCAPPTNRPRCALLQCARFSFVPSRSQCFLQAPAMRLVKRSPCYSPIIHRRNLRWDQQWLKCEGGGNVRIPIAQFQSSCGIFSPMLNPNRKNFSRDGQRRCLAEGMSSFQEMAGRMQAPQPKSRPTISTNASPATRHSAAPKQINTANFGRPRQ
jgi:hypothetical protein